MSTDDGPVPNLSDTCRTLFGTITLTSPRLWHCRCSSHQAASFSPLVELVSERTARELLVMETNRASLVSYGMTVEALKDFLPVDETLSVSTVRTNALAVAQRCEAELGEEQWSFMEGCPRDWGNLPCPDGPISVGIDGGYVRDWEEKQRNVEVIGGKGRLAFTREEDDDNPSSKCFGFVQSDDTKPKRRLFEVLSRKACRKTNRSPFCPMGRRRSATSSCTSARRPSTSSTGSTSRCETSMPKAWCTTVGSWARKSGSSWKRAQLPLQTRVKTLNHELGAVFRRW